MKYSLSYIVRIQFLGFRFHGWQKQSDVKTIHDSLDKTLSFVFGHFNFKTVGVGRLDAMVSSVNYPFQLFTDTNIDEERFIARFNKNCPSDFRCLNITPCALNFAIINAPKIKTYHYYFSLDKKAHPYAAPLVSNFDVDIDLAVMTDAARLFEGTHHFRKYCCKPTVHTQFNREITACYIKENTILTANFFSDKSYVLVVKGTGFLRYQIRYMMAVLLKVGSKEISLAEFKQSLRKDNDGKPWNFIAPQSGLHLHDVTFL